MVNGIRTGDRRGFNKGRSSKFREGSRVRQTPEEDRRTYRPKRLEMINTLNGISTLESYLMPNPVYAGLLNELVCSLSVKIFQV